jgi:hypothetical protein
LRSHASSQHHGWHCQHSVLSESLVGASNWGGSANVTKKCYFYTRQWTGMRLIALPVALSSSIRFEPHHLNTEQEKIFFLPLNFSPLSRNFLPLSFSPLSRRSSSNSATFSSDPNLALLSQSQDPLSALLSSYIVKKNPTSSNHSTTNIIKTPLLIMVNTICSVSILVKLGIPGNANGNITTPNFQHVTMHPWFMPWWERFTTPLA